MPFVDRHLPIFEKLSIPWEWRIAEGTAANTHCTSWCSKMAPRLSRDGTSEYLTSIMDHPNVKVFRRQLWDGKVAMCNTCLSGLSEECVLVQCDIDEFFTTEQLERIVKMFEERPEAMRAYFWCHYWLGENILSTSTDGYGNRAVGEWARAFRFRPGMVFNRHEPPVLNENRGIAITRGETAKLGLVFEHYAWYYEFQAAAKQNFYQYADALKHWKRLQENTAWPVRDLRSFLPWVGPGASADLVSNLKST